MPLYLCVLGVRSAWGADPDTPLDKARARRLLPARRGRWRERAVEAERVRGGDVMSTSGTVRMRQWVGAHWEQQQEHIPLFLPPQVLDMCKPDSIRFGDAGSSHATHRLLATGSDIAGGVVYTHAGRAESREGGRGNGDTDRGNTDAEAPRKRAALKDIQGMRGNQTDASMNDSYIQERENRLAKWRWRADRLSSQKCMDAKPVKLGPPRLQATSRVSVTVFDPELLYGYGSFS
ncbi:hypothetical protein C8R45DRAFT_941700 [Mycena sanguinolenta]|nr:hypothetical protein C8R45DRAFT_941700 [Mycena sanguinolenta]